MQISWRHDLDVIVLGNNGCHSVALGGTVQLIACVFCSVPHKTKFMCAAVNDWVCISQKNRLIPRRQNAVSEDCVYVHVSVSGCACVCLLWKCAQDDRAAVPQGNKDTNSHHCRRILRDTSFLWHCPFQLLFLQSLAGNTHTHTLNTPVSPSLIHLSPPISLTQEKSCHSLSTSRSLISDYQAGSCRSETIAHQTWLPVPMEPVGNRWSLRRWTWALALVA